MEERSPLGDDDRRAGPDPVANLAVLAVILVVTLLAYWAFTGLQHSRRYERCLDVGQRNCINFLDRAAGE